MPPGGPQNGRVVHRGRNVDPGIARSWLLVNGARTELFDSAHDSRADQIVLDIEDAVDPARREHLALLWADARAPGRDPELVRFDLVRPRGSSGRRVDVDWHVGLLDRLRSNAA